MWWQLRQSGSQEHLRLAISSSATVNVLKERARRGVEGSPQKGLGPW